MRGGAAVLAVASLGGCSLITSFAGLDDGASARGGATASSSKALASETTGATSGTSSITASVAASSSGGSVSSVGATTGNSSSAVTTSASTASGLSTSATSSGAGGAPVDAGPCKGAPVCAGNVVTGLSSLRGITVDAGLVYWVEISVPGIYSVPVEGGQPTRVDLAGDALADPFDVAIDGGYLYWTEQSAAVIVRRLLAGGAREVLPGTGAARLAFLTVAQGMAFASDDIASNPNAGNVYYASPQGGGLFASQFQQLAGLGQSAGTLLLAQAPSGSILTTPTSSGMPVYLGYAQGSVAGLAYDGTAAYFVESQTELAAVTVSDGVRHALEHLPSSIGLGDLATDDQYVYLGEPTLGRIYRYPKPF